MKKRLLSILLLFCMALFLLPAPAQAETAAAGAAIRLSTTGIHGYSAENGYSYIYYGTWQNQPIKWRVLDTKANTGETGALFLLTDECLYPLEGGLFDCYIQFNPLDKMNRHLWQGSTLQNWFKNTFYSGENSAFTDAERALIPAVSAEDSQYKYYPSSSSYVPQTYHTGGLESEYVFAPSIAELCNADYGFTDSTPQMAGPFDSTSAGTRYWIRSYFNNLPHYVGEYANMTGDQIATSAAVRPAMNLSTAGNNILFASAAVGGKPAGGLTAIPAYDGNEWKLTLSDSSRSNFKVTTTAVSAATKGSTVEIEYANAKTGNNEYISALIFDDVGNVIYYGRSNAPLTEADGTAELTVPAGFAKGTYTMSVFNEQYNGDYKTDLASAFTDVTLTVEKRVDEQFTLTPGGRYYFDLSAMNIPGTVNSNLPDSTLHYVPFTYAGTVDAYKRTGVSDKNTDAYEHSLFIADYAVTHTVSWNDLNAQGMIFGKTYTSGGIDYTLRAPSVGRDYTGGGETKRGAPINNEWDTIFDKAKQDRLDNTGGYIKNWKDILSFGQEGYGDINDNPAVRGYYTAFFYNYTGASSAKAGYGFRPVLELPTDLSADSLKAVELITDGRMSGETYKSINIIVKKGESFTAPSAEGLPLSDNISADTPMWWVDENRNFYKPGDTVPADVSALTAFYGGFGLFLNRGDGAVEVTPDNYTDIFGDGTASFVVPQGKSYVDIAKSSRFTVSDALEILATGKFKGNIFPNLKLKNADLTSVTLSEGYIGGGSPLFITLDGKNTIGSLNGIDRGLSTLSILGDGTLTLNSALKLSIYAQYGGSSVTVTGGLNIASALCIDSGSLTVTGDTQAVTLPSKSLGGWYLDDGIRLFLGSSANDTAEAALPQLSPEMQALYERYLAGDSSLTQDELEALDKALTKKWNDTLELFSDKTYVRFTNAWNVTYLPGADGTGTAVTDIKLYNDALTLCGALFTRTGYTQTGWTTTDGGEKVYDLGGVYTTDAALTLYPAWTANRYTVTFDTAGGSEIAPITQDYGAAITAPADPTKTGYTFAGWSPALPSAMPAENLTLTAQWTPNRYTVTLDPAGGRVSPEALSVTYLTPYGALPTPARSDYRFDGWYLGEEKIESQTVMTQTAPHTLTACWTFQPSQITGPSRDTLILETNGGSTIDSIHAARGTTLDLSSLRPEKSGFRFTGWYLDKALTQPVSSLLLDGDQTVYAGWAPLDLPFRDVRPEDWFYADVRYVYESGLMNGTAEGLFSPDLFTSRAMIVTVLWRLSGSPVVNYYMPFADVDQAAWYAEAVRWAASCGIVSGYGNGDFGPSDPITREQLAAILYRCAAYRQEDTSVGADTNILSFTDAASVSEYAVPALQWACGAGILQGADGALLPAQPATRAQTAAILTRYLKAQ